MLDWARRQGTLSSEPRAAKEPRSTVPAEPQLRPVNSSVRPMAGLPKGSRPPIYWRRRPCWTAWYNRARWSGYARVSAVMTASVVKIACAKVGALILWAARIAPRLYAAVASETNVT